MRVELDPRMQGSATAAEAQRIIESCVHCGMCTSVCPTYEILNHELDSPRGRIYLIREMLQGGTVSEQTRNHLDHCLTCRACETACPSGVEYGHLIDIGRQEIERRVPRSTVQRGMREALRRFLLSPSLLRSSLQLGWALRSMLPGRLRAAIPARPAPSSQWPTTRHPRRVLTLAGCVQSSLAPGYDLALARLLDRFGVSLVQVQGTGCCGALSQHLGAADSAADAMRTNIDAWWPLISEGAEAIIASSSGCGAMVKDYGHLLQGDAAYAAKAQRVSALFRDPAEIIADLWAAQPLELEPIPAGSETLAFHPPCTLQHGLRLKGRVEPLLQRAGYRLTPVKEAHMCCGSAGTYSILQPALSQKFQSRKLANLMAGRPQGIASANIGCIMHLQKHSPVAVRHWLELLAARLPAQQEGLAHE